MSEICNWDQGDDDWGAYETDCGMSFNIIDGTPADNHMVYCCYCGRKLIGKPFEYEEDDQ